MNDISAFVLALVSVFWVAELASAQYVPAVEPLLPNSNHQNEDHSGHFHSNILLSTIDLSETNLSGTNFSQSTLYRVKLVGADLTGSDLTSTKIRNCLLTKAQFANAIITDAHFWFSGLTLDQLKSTANYQSKDLRGVDLIGNDLSGWNLVGQDLTGADLSDSNLSGADFTDAVITNLLLASTNLSRTNGMSSQQLYSTASYKAGDLRGVDFSYLNLSNWNLSGQNLTGASFVNANLAGVDFSGATIAKVNLNGSQIGLTREQLYSTASYQTKSLQGITFKSLDLSGWDLSGQDLTGANLEANLANVNFSGAKINNVQMRGATASGNFTADQLYSTASYQQKELSGIQLHYEQDLRGWNFTSQNLTNASFEYALIKEADFSGANLSGANFGGSIMSDGTRFDGAVVAGAEFGGAGLTSGQLYGTASYAAGNLRGIGLSGSDLSGWDFSHQDLTGADLRSSALTGTDFSGATIAGTRFGNSSGGSDTQLTREQLYSTASYAAKDLREISFGASDMTGWDLSGQDLSGTYFGGGTLAEADFGGATIRGVFFGSTKFTREQLYSTASYVAKDLRAIAFPGDVSGWDFSGQDLTDSWFRSVANADFTGATIVGAHFGGYGLPLAANITPQQLYSTASYHEKDLRRIGIYFNKNDLVPSWNFRDQNLIESIINTKMIPVSDFSGADLRGARSGGDLGMYLLDLPVLSVHGAVARNTVLSDGQLEGLELAAGETFYVRDFNPVYTPGSIPIRVVDDLQLQPGSTMEFRLEDADWSSTMILYPDVTATLTGARMHVTLQSPTIPIAPGTTFKLFDWSGPLDPTNRFAELKLPSGMIWDTEDLYVSGEIRLVGISLDLNNDQDVDSEDLLSFLGNWTGSDPSVANKTRFEGDGDADGDVDSADMLVLLSQWTGAASGRDASLAAVPEPTLGLSPVLGCLLWGLTRRRCGGTSRR